MAFPLPWGGEGQGEGDNDLLITPTLILPPAFAEAASRRQALKGRRVFFGVGYPAALLRGNSFCGKIKKGHGRNEG